MENMERQNITNVKKKERVQHLPDSDITVKEIAQ
jgi:hypothetical protein